jgi:hypothetical protein
VVVVVVGDEDPSDVLGVDHRERGRQPCVAYPRATRVDDDGLGAPDHHGVDRHERARGFGDQRRDDEGVAGDLVGPSGQDLEFHRLLNLQ